MIASSQRVRSSASGHAVSFASLTAFGDAHGTGVETEYESRRLQGSNPGSNGWSTHAITPREGSGSVIAVTGTAGAYYPGEFDSNLGRGIFFTTTPLTGDTNVVGAANLYLRRNLDTPGPGTYALVSACPFCQETATPVSPLPAHPAAMLSFLPYLAGSTPDMGIVAFESVYNLTRDAPAQDPLCGTGFPPQPPPWSFFCQSRLYEWDHGTLRFAGVLPDGSPSAASIAGHGARNDFLTPHVVSNGSDGHTRIFFTQPTDNSGSIDNFGSAGRLFMRVDHAETEQLNASERTNPGPDTYTPAEFLDATPDGVRSVILSNEALTNDAPADGLAKIYMYDASRPASAPDNLTFLSDDQEPNDGDGANARGLLGLSDDGRYVYMLLAGQIARGGPTGKPQIVLWHDGVLSSVSPATFGTASDELLTGTPDFSLVPRQARVTPDGRHVLISAIDGADMIGYDHGNCRSFLGIGCRELYIYSANTGQVACASCNPSGAPATAMATVTSVENTGASHFTSHQNHPLSDDGSHVFFTSAEALVPEDTNNRMDAYEYDVESRKISLISSGKSTFDSWFMDASADGRDVFFVTRERFVGWDIDDAYDLYDARIGGGFPEPAVRAPPCQGPDCQGPPASSPSDGAIASRQFAGAGNEPGKLKPRHARRCPRGRTLRRVRGKRRCVRVKRRTHHKSRTAAQRRLS